MEDSGPHARSTSTNRFFVACMRDFRKFVAFINFLGRRIFSEVGTKFTSGPDMLYQSCTVCVLHRAKTLDLKL